MHVEIIQGSANDKNKRSCYDYIYKKALELMEQDEEFKRAVYKKIEGLRGEK